MLQECDLLPLLNPSSGELTSLALGRPTVEALLDHSPLDVHQMVGLEVQISLSVCVGFLHTVISKVPSSSFIKLGCQGSGMKSFPFQLHGEAPLISPLSWKGMDSSNSLTTQLNEEGEYGIPDITVYRKPTHADKYTCTSISTI